MYYFVSGFLYWILQENHTHFEIMLIFILCREHIYIRLYKGRLFFFFFFLLLGIWSSLARDCILSRVARYTTVAATSVPQSTAPGPGIEPTSMPMQRHCRSHCNTVGTPRRLIFIPSAVYGALDYLTFKNMYILFPQLECMFLEGQDHILYYFILFYYLFIYFCLFLVFSRAAPAAYGGSQAGGLIGAVASGLGHSHCNMRCEPRPTPQLTSDPWPTEWVQGWNPKPHGS